MTYQPIEPTYCSEEELRSISHQLCGTTFVQVALSTRQVIPPMFYLNKSDYRFYFYNTEGPRVEIPLSKQRAFDLLNYICIQHRDVPFNYGSSLSSIKYTELVKFIDESKLSISPQDADASANNNEEEDDDESLQFTLDDEVPSISSASKSPTNAKSNASPSGVNTLFYRSTTPSSHRVSPIDSSNPKGYEPTPFGMNLG